MKKSEHMAEKGIGHLEMEVSHKTDEQVRELGHCLDTSTEQSDKVFPLFKTIIVLSN